MTDQDFYSAQGDAIADRVESGGCPVVLLARGQVVIVADRWEPARGIQPFWELTVYDDSVQEREVVGYTCTRSMEELGMDMEEFVRDFIDERQDDEELS